MSYFKYVFLFVRQKALIALGKEYRNNIAHSNFLVRIKRAVGLILFHKFKRSDECSGNAAKSVKPVWFFANTINQYSALKPIFEIIKESSTYALLSSNEKLKQLSSGNNQLIIEEALIRKYWYKLPLFLLKAFFHSPYFAYRYFDAIIKNFGYLELFKSYIKKYEPRLIVFSHDHLPLYRTLMWAARKMKVKTAYIQHAAVSDLFPPLSFDLAILDGEDSLRKYKTDSSFKTNVKVIGSAKYDAFFFNRKFNKCLKAIGVCYSNFDDIDVVMQLLNYLAPAFPEQTIVIRPHPSDNRKPDFSGMYNNIRVSDSSNESSLEYLSKIDVLVSGSSTILLEATAMNIVAYYYSPLNTNSAMDDYYGFVKHNVARRVTSISKLKELISTEYNEHVYVNAKYYIYNIGESYEGNTASVVAKEIQHF